MAGRMRTGSAAAWLLLLSCAAGHAFAGAGREAPLLQITLAPQVDPAHQGIEAVNVTMTMSDARVASGMPLLQMPIVIYNVETVAKTLTGLSASDAKGPIGLSVRDDPEGGTEFNRHWLASRKTEGALIVSYRAPVSGRLAPLGAAPPTELRSDGLAFSAGGATFLTLPVTETAHRVSVRWDLSALPKDSAALSSIGVGEAVSPDPIPVLQLMQMFFMAGRVGHLPQSPAGFFAGWQGTPPFDAHALMQWTGRLYDRYVVFFRQDTRLPYGVFLRPNPVNPGGGIGQEHSFVATFDGKTLVDDLELTLAHEMLHTFIRGLEGDENLENGWFSEGLAVYYQRVLPVRFGLMSTEDFLLDLNRTAGRYYTNALAGTPNAEIPAHFWSNTLIRVLPYDRGALYFATVDDAVREKSQGRRSLDDLLLAMLQRRREKGDVRRDDWEKVVSAELGPPGLDDFRSMLAGRPVLPAPDAFGPCFRRTSKVLRRYELGFDPAVMAERRRVVRGLLADSAAARAGLRDGDEILKPFGQDAVQADQNATLTVDVRREGKEFRITYLPRGERVPAYQWERVPGSAEANCVR